MCRGEDLPWATDLRFESLWQRVHVVFHFDEAQGPTNIAIGNVRPSKDDVVFDCAFKQRQLGIDHESAEAINGVQFDVAEVDAVVTNDAVRRRFQSSQDPGQ